MLELMSGAAFILKCEHEVNTILTRCISNFTDQLLMTKLSIKSLRLKLCSPSGLHGLEPGVPWCLTPQAPPAGRHVGPAHHPRQHVISLGHRLGLHHGGLPLLAPLAVLLVPGSRLLLFDYFSVFIYLKMISVHHGPACFYYLSSSLTSVSSSSGLSEGSSITRFSIFNPVKSFLFSL